jgi:hypothetical protein
VIALLALVVLRVRELPLARPARHRGRSVNEPRAIGASAPCGGQSRPRVSANSPDPTPMRAITTCAKERLAADPERRDRR